jgi:hypothetical protein
MNIIAHFSGKYVCTKELSGKNNETYSQQVHKLYLKKNLTLKFDFNKNITIGGNTMRKGNIRRMFPGGNTSMGFFSYYDYILDQEEARKIIILKGGPGVGKSTFMKSIGMEMADRGFDIEFMHCSSDNNSLDGVVIPEIKAAILDGTAPHVVDPKNPGAVDEIINLGDFWDEDGIIKNRQEILEENRKTGRLFSRAYRYLKAAALFHEDIKIINNWALDMAKINEAAHDIIKELFNNKNISKKVGKQRRLFASAITPAGLKNYLETVLTPDNVYAIKGKSGTGTEILLDRVCSEAVQRGFYTESYYCALNPGKIEHLVIPEMNVSFTTRNNYHNADIAGFKKYDFDEFLDKTVISSHSEVLQYNSSMFEALLAKVVDTIKDAKAAHDLMEKHYIPNMDFEAVTKCRETTLKKILGYANH